MRAEEFEKFVRLIGSMFGAWGLPCNDDTMRGYWRALKDFDYRDIEANVDRVLKGSETDRQQYPPKPWQLRPLSDLPTGLPPEQDGRLMPAVIRNMKLWDEIYLDDPVWWAIRWNF